MKRRVVMGAGMIFSALLLWVGMGAGEPSGPSFSSVEERRLVQSLQQERTRLQAEIRQKEEKLALREIELKTLATEVDKKIEELKKVREELIALQAPGAEAESRRAKELARIYEKMDPTQAAAMLGDLEQELAVRILAGMKAKAAGRLLAAMPPEKAARLSAAYSTLLR